MKECIIDTDIFSYYMRNIPNVVDQARNYLDQFGYFNISSLTVSFIAGCEQHTFQVPSGTTEFCRP